jgi:acyl-coenzyme A synthetase/AMP-(fatty) acid ligase
MDAAGAARPGDRPTRFDGQAFGGIQPGIFDDEYREIDESMVEGQLALRTPWPSNTAGHLVGSFEVESALVEHPAVAKAGVIRKPDPVAMEIVKAFVSLNEGYEPNESLRRELMNHTRTRLGPNVVGRSTSSPASRRRAPARSCAAC